MHIKPVGSGRHPGGTVTAETGGAEGASAARSNLPWIIGKNRPHSAYFDKVFESAAISYYARIGRQAGFELQLGVYAEPGESAAVFWNLRTWVDDELASKLPADTARFVLPRPPRRREASPPVEPTTPNASGWVAHPPRS
jgi:hypothetical protein